MAAVAILKPASVLAMSMSLLLLLFLGTVEGQRPSDKGPPPGKDPNKNGNATQTSNQGATVPATSAAAQPGMTSQSGQSPNVTSPSMAAAGNNATTPSTVSSLQARSQNTTQNSTAQNTTIVTNLNTDAASSDLTASENRTTPLSAATNTSGNASTVAMVVPEATTEAPTPDPCLGNPCQNGVTCIANGTNYICICQNGWQGVNCTEDVDECLGSPCLHNGACTNVPGGFNCTCPQGTLGDMCEINIDECANSPCQNNATCVDGFNEFTCNCTEGWNGTLCNEDVDECILGLHKCDLYATCKNTNGTYECPCNEGYEASGNSCIFKDTCDPDPCTRGNCVSKLTTHTCVCEKGWKGVNCTEDVNECEGPTQVCSTDNGVCQNSDGSFSCSCRIGFIGDGVTCTENVMYPYSRDFGYHSDDNIFGHDILNGFPYFGKLYNRLYISLDGAIFIGERPRRLPTWPEKDEFPANVRMVAPFWTDIDTFQGQGAVYTDVYSHVLPLAENDNSTAYEIVQRLKHDVTSVGVEDFDPSYVIITTWENVSPFPANLYDGIENITFQAVLATDNKQSVALYNFLHGGNFLNPDNDIRPIVIGYTDGIQPMYAVVTNRTYMADKGTNVEKPGRYVFKLGDQVENFNLDCYKWHSKQTMAMNSAHLDPCPCTLHQAKLDTSFEVNETSSCATSRFAKNNITQFCCYEKVSGALILGSLDAGFPLFQGETPYENEGRSLCCIRGNACYLFYHNRPSDTCEKYSSPSVGVIYGDPHVQTLDGSAYDFNGLGQHWLLNLNDGRFLLQGRTVLNNAGSYNKTTLSALALQGNDTDKIEVRLSQDGSTAVVHIEGVTSMQLDAVAINEKVMFVGGYMIKQSAKMFLIQLEMKIGVKVHVSSGALWMEVIVSDAYRGADSSVGLLGVFDGRADNDFKMPSGDAVVTAESEQKFLKFGNNWTINANNSLFTYSLDGPGKSWNDFNSPDFMPTIFMDVFSSDLTNSSTFNFTRMKIFCENSTPCLIDYAVTGNEDIAATTKDMQEYVANNQAILRSTPPRFLNMPEVLEVKAFEVTKLNLSVNIKDVTFSVNTTFVPSYTLNGSVLEWIPALPNNTDMQNLYFKVTAKNDLGLSATYSPIMKMCPLCLNGGGCLTVLTMDMMTGGLTSGKVFMSQCACKPGFDGPTCSNSVDPCIHSVCPKGTTCTSTPGVGIGYKCGECPPGYSMRHSKCYDNNECIDGSAMCSQKCKNKPGSYECLCEPGFELQADKHSCKDIDECTKMVCSSNQYCINTIGSHYCQCKASYFMDGGVCRHGPKQFGGQMVFKYINLTDRGLVSWTPDMAKPNSDMFYKVATRVEEELNKAFRTLDQDNFLSSKVYTLQKGSIIARFNAYFTMGASPTDKSLGGALQSHLVSAGCTMRGPDCEVGNLVGVSPIWSYATATNLCLRQQDNNCDTQSTNCTSNGDGTFACSCRTGFQRWRGLTNICQDVDECSNNMTNKCNSTSSMCVNHPGKYECQCRLGYHKLPGASICTDVCEPNPCKNNGICKISNEGNSRYTCKCTGSWTGHHCEFEHEQSKRLETAVIIIAVILGSLTLIFFILMIFCWCRYSRKCRARRAKRQYNTSEAVDGWAEPTTMIGSTPRNPSLFEMKENGNSKQNLLEQKYGVRPADDDSSLAGGVQNPAYTSSFQPQGSNKGSDQF